jgi:hypothetical protein
VSGQDWDDETEEAPRLTMRELVFGDDRQQADMCRYCCNPTTDTDRIPDPLRPGRVTHAVCALGIAVKR